MNQGRSRPGDTCLRASRPMDTACSRRSWYEWVFEADEQRRREIDALVQGAIWSTLHRWV